MIKGIINRLLVGNKLNILTFPTHSPYEATLANQLQNVTFYAYRDEGIIPQWNPLRDKPDNYILLEEKQGDNSIPRDVDFHLILCQNVAAQYKYAARYSQLMGIPIVNVVHTMPPLGFSQDYLNNYKKLSVAANVFITEYSRDIWGFGEPESGGQVIYHGIEQDLYTPMNLVRNEGIMTLGNEYEQRWRELGFDIYTKIIQGLPCRHYGTSSGGQLPNNPLSTLRDVVRSFAASNIFLNTSRWSPIPRSLCEAMMCGAPIVTSNGCAIPEVLTHEYDCLMFPLNKPELGRKYCEHLLKNPKEAEQLGNNARKTAMRVFNVDRFRREFDEVFRNALKS